jgi:hypothetical protein
MLDRNRRMLAAGRQQLQPAIELIVRDSLARGFPFLNQATAVASTD